MASKNIPNEFMVLIISVKSSSTRNYVNFVNHGPVLSTIDDKTGYALGHGYVGIDKFRIDKNRP